MFLSTEECSSREVIPQTCDGLRPYLADQAINACLINKVNRAELMYIALINYLRYKDHHKVKKKKKLFSQNMKEQYRMVHF